MSLYVVLAFIIIYFWFFSCRFGVFDSKTVSCSFLFVIFRFCSIVVVSNFDLRLRVYRVYFLRF